MRLKLPNTSREVSPRFGRTAAWKRLVLSSTIPAGLLFCPSANAASVTWNGAVSPSANDNFGSGLREGMVSGSFNTTSANPNTSVASGTRMAQLTGGWSDNTTWIYTGEVFAGSNGKLAFAEQFDDNVQVKLGGVEVLNNTSWNTPTTTGVLDLQPNTWYPFEARFGQGGGGAGPNSGWSIGFGYRADGQAGTTQAGYVAPVDNGSQNLFRYLIGAGTPPNDTITVTGNTTATISGSAATLVEESITFNPTTRGPVMLTLSGVNKTLSATNGTTLATSNDATVTIAGDASFRTGALKDGGFTNVSLRRAGTGTLIIDAAAGNQLGNTKLIIDSGRVSIVGTNGVNPAATLSSTIDMNGGALRVGSSTATSTTFDHAVQVNNSAKLEHTATSTDTLGSATKGINIAASRTLEADISAGVLNLGGAVTGGIGSTLIKSGTSTLRASGLISVPTVRVNAGTLESAPNAISSTSNVFLTGGTLSFASAQASSTPLTVFGGNVIVPYNGAGGINVATPNAPRVQLNNVTLGFGDANGHLQTNLTFTGSSAVQIANTTLTGTGNYGINVAGGEVDLGNLTTNFSVVLHKNGAGTLNLRGGTSSLGSGDEVMVNAGRLNLVRTASNSDPLNSAQTTVARGAIISYDSIGAGTVASSSGNLGFLGGAILQAKSGITDLGNNYIGTLGVINTTGQAEGAGNSGLQAFSLKSTDASLPNTGLGITGAAGVSMFLNRADSRGDSVAQPNGSVASTVLAAAPLTFANDAAFHTFFGTMPEDPARDRFTAGFVGKFTAQASGIHRFGFGANDDSAAVWVDLNQNGIFEENGTGGNERLTFRATSGSADITGNADLLAGQSYNFALVMEDAGSQSALAGKWAAPNGQLQAINPSATQTNWTSDVTLGGARIQVEAGAELRMRQLDTQNFNGTTTQNFRELDFNGQGGVMRLDSGAEQTTSAVTSMRTIVAQTTSTLHLGGNNTLNVGGFSNAGTATFVKSGAGTLNLAHHALGSGSTFRVQGGTVNFNGDLPATAPGAPLQNGGIQVAAGTANINGRISGAVTVEGTGVLGGSGAILNTISGTGTVAPGNSAGMLTANAINPLQGVDVALEFMTKGAPNLANPQASGNDVLRLTAAAPFSSSTLTGNNRITINIQVANIALGDVFQGGFYTDAGDFSGALAGASFDFRHFGSSTLPSGVNWFEVSMVSSPFDFDGAGANPMVNGYLMQIVAVPEPTTFVTLMTGLGLVGGLRMRRRSR